MSKTILPIDWTPIRHVVLDFGGVLYDIDHAAPAKAFFDLGFTDFQNWFAHGHQYPVIDDLECGRISDHMFLQVLQSRCTPGTTLDDVKKAWNSILIGLRPDIMPVLTALKSQFDLVLFSNTNAIHAQFFERQILDDIGRDFSNAFRQIIYSHRLGERKPDPKAYLTLAKELDLDASGTLFIDDTESNVVGAIHVGWQATLHNPKDRSLGQLFADLGLKL